MVIYNYAISIMMQFEIHSFHQKNDQGKKEKSCHDVTKEHSFLVVNLKILCKTLQHLRYTYRPTTTTPTPDTTSPPTSDNLFLFNPF